MINLPSILSFQNFLQDYFQSHKFNSGLIDSHSSFFHFNHSNHDDLLWETWNILKIGFGMLVIVSELILFLIYVFSFPKQKLSFLLFLFLSFSESILIIIKNRRDHIICLLLCFMPVPSSKHTFSPHCHSFLLFINPLKSHSLFLKILFRCSSHPTTIITF